MEWYTACSIELYKGYCIDMLEGLWGHGAKAHTEDYSDLLAIECSRPDFETAHKDIKLLIDRKASNE